MLQRHFDFLILNVLSKFLIVVNSLSKVQPVNSCTVVISTCNCDIR